MAEINDLNMKQIYLTALFLIIINSVFCQDGPKVVVFNQSSSEEPLRTPPNLFKVSLFEILAGDISLYYERVLSERLSAEVGLGMTIDDYFAGIFSNSIYDDFYFDDDRTALMGYSFGLGLRYYPYSASDEFYFAPEFKYRYYHSEVNYPYTNNMGQVDYFTDENSKDFMNFRISVGYVYFFDDNIFVDYFAGIGVAKFKYTYYSSVYDPNTDSFDYTQITDGRISPRLTLGLKFGFAL